MTNRRLVTLFVIALIGYGGLFFLFPKTNPAARWNFAMDRAAAIEQVKAAAPSYGYALSASDGPTAFVKVEYQRHDEYYLSRQANPLLDSIFTPLKVQVRLTEPKSSSFFEARLNSRGEWLGYRRRERPPKKDSETTIANDQKIADEALKKFLGERYGKFSFLSASTDDEEEREFTWKASDEGLNVLADVTVSYGKVAGVWLQSNLTPRFQAESSSRRGVAIVALSNAVQLLIWPSIVLVIIFYFVSIARRQIDHRKTLTFLACAFTLLSVTNLFGSFADQLFSQLRINGSTLSYTLGVAVRLAIVIAINLCIAALLYLFLAPGLALSGAAANRRTVGLELLLRGKLLRKPVTGSIVAGLLAGGLLEMITHAVAATGVFAGALIDADDLNDIFGARIPWIDAFFEGGQFQIFISFAFLIPAAEAFMKRMWFQRILAFVIAFLTMAGLDPFHSSAPALAVASLLQAYLLIQLHRNFGLLAVMVSVIASNAALSSATLLAQSSTALQASGRNVIIGLGTALIAALVGLWKSSEAKEEEIAVKEIVENAERERLQAEFGVARKAQLRMLPDAPPAVPGLAISAVCNPSKEVGGDLYDFLDLPGGKLGVVVADVSGKGVPASLYMTLTKGLLDSISEHKSDPGEILREVNRHLYDVCRRKTFVTMFLGVIDPGRKTLSYARAGHNPTVIYRNGRNGGNGDAPESKTWMLKSRGMGLGLNSGKIFDQSLKVETLQLERGDKLFFYSDGITEAMNEKRDEYGEERLMALAQTTNGLNAEQSRDAVMADVAKFLGPVPPQDDQTLVVLQIL